ncbi:universal stress protein UspA [Candidatus Methanomethylophilus sp. 1R26]|jgi:nucleotide-binding universal stress UspA family protein|uniref:universal stress protein n=1 Tax=Candidatus Methanomethylophilus sp. 1R26 TaxID=1769296 RepID=UPI000736813E|nr:universal stress protein [Candidatus Methanomethylophilus sp. 1R26]MCI2074674.1 universal stress protein [Methanomethylophilus sp.]TQS81103.1 MAG: universal stress protein UspA [Methanomethylophilus alvi]WII09196.1 universal stress protein [Methanomassiliicoccales archaeon LGM-DZ1]KUE74117.1 universal stress protein UspA [Candidatus Methanomethylophilus sp. 1R26]MCI2093440.1 universal stress protein [Methanomethylophilus sp.]
MSFQNILVPTDGSEAVKTAVAEAVELAKTAKGHITALFVKDKYATDAAADAAVGYVEEQCKAAGIPFEKTVLSGVPAEVIAKKSADHDVIVMGTLGRTGMKKLLVGSVAEKVVKLATCPVIVVRNSE